jgi:hypothetical protein
VDQFYTTMLGRSADLAGVQYWSNLLLSGRATSESVAIGILDSDEFWQEG